MEGIWGEIGRQNVKSGSILTPDMQQWNIGSSFFCLGWSLHDDWSYKDRGNERKNPEYRILSAVFWVLQEKVELEMEGNNYVLRVAFYLWPAIQTDWAPLSVLSRVKNTTDCNGYYSGFEAVTLTGNNNWVTCFSQLLVIY